MHPPQSEPTRIGALNPAVYNPRTMPPGEKAKLKASLRAFGFVQPVVARRSDGLLIGGHQRLDAWADILRDAGMSEADILDACVPAVLLDIDDADAMALNLALNKISGEWDTSKLAAVLDTLSAVAVPRLELTGFTLPEIASLRLPAPPPPSAEAPASAATGGAEKAPPRDPVEVVEDAPPGKAEELREKWKTAPGQLWEIPTKHPHGGAHRLLCGDSTDPAVVARVMGTDRAEVLHTDPPYGVDVSGSSHNPTVATYNTGPRVANDDLDDTALEALVAAAFRSARAHMTPGAAFYIWHPDTRVEVFLRALKVLGPLREIVVWVKAKMVFGRKDYHYKHEACLYGWLPDAGHRWTGDRTQTTVWEAAPVGVDLPWGFHPTAKPLALPARAIQNHTDPGGVVLDVFHGSGSTMVAAEQTGRLCRAVELDPKYVALALERMSAQGCTPRLVTS